MKIEFKQLTDVKKSDIIALMNHPKVRIHMPLAPTVFDDAAFADFIATKEDLWKKHGYGPWAFFFDGQFTGWGGLQYEEGDADLAMVLHPDYWGFGLAVFSAIVEKFFAIMTCESITALLPPSRIRLKALARLGFKPDGELILNGHRFLRFRLHAKNAKTYCEKLFSDDV